MHGGSSLATVTHSQNHGGTATYDIATRENGRNGRLHPFVDHDGSPAAYIQPAYRTRNEWVRGYTDAHHDDVHIDQFNGTRNLNRFATTGSIRFAQGHFLQTHLFDKTAFVTDVFDGIVQVHEFDTFFLSVDHFFQAGRHFFFGTAINDHGAFSTQTSGRTDGVHGGIATTDD